MVSEQCSCVACGCVYCLTLINISFVVTQFKLVWWEVDFQRTIDNQGMVGRLKCINGHLLEEYPLALALQAGREPLREICSSP